jgi:hypothetical protein
MSKKPNLAAALLDASGKPPAKQPQAIATARPGKNPATAPAGRRPGRAETRVVSGHFDPAVQKQLRQMALDDDSTVQELLREALNDLFTKHKRKPLA